MKTYHHLSLVVLMLSSFFFSDYGRHHIYEKHGGPKSIDLKEVGPRFELRLYQVKKCPPYLAIAVLFDAFCRSCADITLLFLPGQIKRGTMDQSEAQNEFVLRPYMNTAKKQKSLGV